MGNITCLFFSLHELFIPSSPPRPQPAKDPIQQICEFLRPATLVGEILLRTGDLELVAWRWGFQQLGRDGFGSLDRQRQGGAAPRGARATVTLRIRTVL
jgi:hypothetical protein